MRMGRSYPQYGIYRGDIVIVDRSLAPQHDRLVVYTADGSFKCGRVFSYGGKLSVSSNVAFEAYGTPRYRSNTTSSATAQTYRSDNRSDSDITIFGTITFVIHSTTGNTSEASEDTWSTDDTATANEWSDL